MKENTKLVAETYKPQHLIPTSRPLLTLCFWLGLALSFQVCSVAWACGVNAHLWITDSAICQLPVGSKLRAFYSVQRHVDLTRLGSSFPDSGYAINHEYGEIAHWPPFIQTYIEDFHERHGSIESAWSDEALAEVAFILGVAAHGYEDELFDTQFLRWVDQEDQADQDVIDPALDFLLIYEGHSELLPPLEFPSLGVSSALQRAGIDVSVSEVETGVARVHQFALRLSQNPSALRALVERDAPLIPWASQHYLNSRVTGSLAHEPQRVAALLEGLYKRLSGQSIANEVISHVDPIPPAQLSLSALSSGSQAGWITLYFKTGVITESIIQNTQVLVNGEALAVNYRGTRWGGREGYTRLFEITPQDPSVLSENEVIDLLIHPGLETLGGDLSSVSFSYQIHLCDHCETLAEQELNYGGQQQGCFVMNPDSEDMNIEEEDDEDEGMTAQDLGFADLNLDLALSSTVDLSSQNRDYNMTQDSSLGSGEQEEKSPSVNQGCVQTSQNLGSTARLLVFIYFLLGLFSRIIGVKALHKL